MDLKQIEQQYKETQADLKKVNDNLNRYAEQAEKTVKEHQGLSTETKNQVDELLTKQTALLKRIEEAELKLAGDVGEIAKPKYRNLGEMAVADKDFLAGLPNVSNGGRASVVLNSAPADIVSPAVPASFPVIVPHQAPMVPMLRPRLTVRDLIDFYPVKSTNAITYPRQQSEDLRAATVKENPSSGKPKSSLALTTEISHIATIAHWMRVSKQALDDMSVLSAFINNALTYGLKDEEEKQILFGTGDNTDITGIHTLATSFELSSNAPSGLQRLDVIRLALLQAQLTNLPADGIVLSPTDWAYIELLKDNTGRYLVGNPHGMAPANLWGKPVVEAPSFDAGEFLVGSFKRGAMGWDREQLNITVSREDGNNFTKNMVTILCEERIGLSVFYPDSFVKGSFADIISSTSV